MRNIELAVKMVLEDVEAGDKSRHLKKVLK